jgi:hypothetical protein
LRTIEGYLRIGVELGPERPGVPFVEVVHLWAFKKMMAVKGLSPLSVHF